VTRYRIPVAVEVLVAPNLELPRGMLIAATGEPDRYGVCLVEVEDDDAPADLEGKTLSPTFTKNSVTGEVTIADYGEPVNYP
jgi:hypothetical protein